MYAYNKTYLSHAAETFGAMMDYVVNDCNLDGDVFLSMFITSGMAEQFERGNPKYLAGKSAQELAAEAIEAVLGKKDFPDVDTRGFRTREYWAGWALAQYQWYTAKTFASIQRTLPFNEIILLCPTLHEADITKFFSVALDIAKRKEPETNLRRIRAVTGMSQAELAKAAEVSLRSIQMYEQRNKDINKAQAITLAKLARTLGCRVESLLEYDSV